MTSSSWTPYLCTSTSHISDWFNPTFWSSGYPMVIPIWARQKKNRMLKSWYGLYIYMARKTNHLNISIFISRPNPRADWKKPRYGVGAQLRSILLHILQHLLPRGPWLTSRGVQVELKPAPNMVVSWDFTGILSGFQMDFIGICIYIYIYGIYTCTTQYFGCRYRYIHRRVYCQKLGIALFLWWNRCNCIPKHGPNCIWTLQQHGPICSLRKYLNPLKYSPVNKRSCDVSNFTEN